MGSEKEGKCGPCCGTCGIVMGVLVLVAGAALLMFALGSLEGMTAHMVAGGAFVLLGIGKIVHKMGMCPMCK